MRRPGLVALASVLLAACYGAHEAPPRPGVDAGSPRPPIAGCADEGCPAPLVCREGVCVDVGECECASDDDCPLLDCAVPSCVACTCLLRRDPTRCAEDETCAPDGACVPVGPCATDADCPPPPPSECGGRVCDVMRCFVSAEEICDEACDPTSLACVGDSRLITIALRSDYAPGTEVIHVRVLGAEGRWLTSRGLGLADDLLSGIEVDAVRLPPLSQQLTVELVGPGGDTVSSTRILIGSGGDFTFTVVMSR